MHLANIDMRWDLCVMERGEDLGAALTCSLEAPLLSWRWKSQRGSPFSDYQYCTYRGRLCMILICICVLDFFGDIAVCARSYLTLAHLPYRATARLPRLVVGPRDKRAACLCNAIMHQACTVGFRGSTRALAGLLAPTREPSRCRRPAFTDERRRRATTDAT